MELPNNRETVPPQCTVRSQVKHPVPRTGGILLSHWSKGFHRNPQTPQAIAKAGGNPPHPDTRALLLKRAFTHATKPGEVKLVPS